MKQRFKYSYLAKNWGKSAELGREVYSWQYGGKTNDTNFEGFYQDFIIQCWKGKGLRITDTETDKVVFLKIETGAEIARG